MFSQPFHQRPEAITFAQANPKSSITECELWNAFQESILTSTNPNDPAIAEGLFRVYQSVLTITNDSPTPTASRS